jgi:thioredoxin 2
VNAETAVVVCVNCGRKNRVPAAASGVPRCGHCHHPLPWTAVADDDSYHAVVEEAALPVLVDLWAPWCGPCLTMAPILEELAVELAGRVRVAKLNVDESPMTAARFEVRGIPTLIALKGGRELDRIVGVQPKSEIVRRLEQAIA